MNTSVDSANQEQLHVAIIMDGNRRWAKSKALPVFAGHRAGVETLKKIVKYSPHKNIKYLTVFVFSTENWSRQNEEVDFLFSLLEKVLELELQELKAQGVRLRFVGDMDGLKPELRFKLLDAEKQTASNTTIHLQIALNYGSRREILQAAKAIAKEAAVGNLNLDELDEETFGKFLYTKDLPEPDLLIRTGGECRISNYLLWQIAYSEIVVTQTLWPDFTQKDLDACLEEFANRSRRFGK